MASTAKVLHPQPLSQILHTYGALIIGYYTGCNNRAAEGTGVLGSLIVIQLNVKMIVDYCTLTVTWGTQPFQNMIKKCLLYFKQSPERPCYTFLIFICLNDYCTVAEETLSF